MFGFGRKEKEIVGPSKSEISLGSDLDATIQALATMTECTLATVEYMESLKSASKSELSRQKKIAGQGVHALALVGYHTWGRKEGRVDEALKAVGLDTTDTRFALGRRVDAE